MSSLTAYGRHLAERARGVPPLVVDVVLAIACYLTTALYAILNGQAWWVVVVLAAGTALPLLWRRRYPFAVFWIVGIGSVLVVLADAGGDIAPAGLVATYTYAALCPPAKRRVAATATAIGIVVGIEVGNDDLLNLGTNAVMFAVAYALGMSARARRDRIAMLEERTLRLAQEQAAAATRERERIAREMHDILANSMTMVIAQAEAGPVVVRSDPDKAEEIFEVISEAARDALAQLRRALGVLRTDGHTRAPQPGLDALPALVATAEHAGLTATLTEHGTRPDVPADLAATAYRIVQEALTNTIRHAGASRLWVRLHWRGDTLEVVAGDDGRGPAGDDASGQPGEPGGHGLVGMRERVTALGGQLTTGPGPNGTGFQVNAHLPLPEGQPPAAGDDRRR